jgi:hypothetical protein
MTHRQNYSFFFFSVTCALMLIMRSQVVKESRQSVRGVVGLNDDAEVSCKTMSHA